MTPLVAYLLLFVAVGAGFIFVHLVAGKFLRPNKPGAEKQTIYECGEPTIGSAWVQFDLRYYVVALLFVIFDVEVAFFFPWAVVFGKANTLAVTTVYAGESEEAAQARRVKLTQELGLTALPGTTARERDVFDTLNRKGFDAETGKELGVTPRGLAWTGFWDIMVFFGVLMVGFAYLWKRGDINWVRSIA